MSYVWILLASEVPEALLRNIPAQQIFPALPVSLFTLLCVFSYRSSFGFLKARRCQKASLCYPSCSSQSIFLASLCPTPREPLSHSGSPQLLPRQPLLHSPTSVPAPSPPGPDQLNPIPFLDDSSSIVSQAELTAVPSFPAPPTKHTQCFPQGKVLTDSMLYPQKCVFIRTNLCPW